jgi:protein-L-isoaspartate(D-aspartate) O-methyltransferase
VHRDYFIDARKQLIINLKQKGIVSETVLNAMLKVPREQFVPKVLSKRAYEDISLPIDKQQTISQPFTVARMTSLLEVKKGEGFAY